MNCGNFLLIKKKQTNDETSLNNLNQLEIEKPDELIDKTDLEEYFELDRENKWNYLHSTNYIKLFGLGKKITNISKKHNSTTSRYSSMKSFNMAFNRLPIHVIRYFIINFIYIFFFGFNLFNY